MNSKNWVKKFLLIVFLIILLIGSINFIIDPLWTFNHNNLFNKKQKHFNERQQKTNNVFFNGYSEYNGILLGSSRSSFINQNDFINMKIFNYAIESMYPFEYKGYIDFVKDIKEKDLEYIIIGADFYNTKNIINKTFKEPSFYIREASQFAYRYKMLFNLEVLFKSMNNIKINTFSQDNKYYLRDNVKIREKVSEKVRIKNYTKNIIRHTYSFSKANYTWNKDYFSILKQIKEENSNTRFIIFTSPISADLFVSIIKNTNKFEEYKVWIKGLVDLFGEVYCFMDISNITKNLNNYPDDDHFYPKIGKLLANNISLNQFGRDSNQFGTLVNKYNVDSFLDNQFDKILEYSYSKDFPNQDIKNKLKDIK